VCARDEQVCVGGSPAAPWARAVTLTLSVLGEAGSGWPSAGAAPDGDRGRGPRKDWGQRSVS
jgi:hypothetical protein